MANTIDKIYIYPQIFVYTKAYVDAALESPTAEPSINNFGAWIGINSSNALLQYTMNPLNVPEAIKPMIIANSVNQSLNNIGLNITFESIISHFAAGTGSTAYAYDGSTSSNYRTVTIDGIDFVVPFNHLASGIPLHVRFMYYVTYIEGGTTLAAMFPSTANTYYETVLNATGTWKFTAKSTSEHYTGYDKCTWAAYSSDKKLISGGVTGNYGAGFEANINSVPFYLVFGLSVRGSGSSNSVSHYGGSITMYDLGSDYISPVSSNPGGDLSAIYSATWSLSGISSKRTITYETGTCYRITQSWKKNFIYYFAGEVSPAKTYVMYRYESGGQSNQIGYAIEISTDVALPTIFGTHNFSLHKDSQICYAGIQYNNNTGNSVSLSTVTWKILKYALKQGTSEFAAQWGSAITPSGGITLESNVAVTLGSLTSKTIYMNYDNLDDLLDQATITPSAGNTIYAGVFLCQGTLDYTISGGTESVSTKFIVRSGMGSGNNFTLESATNSINSSNQWTSSTFEIRMKETHLDDMQNSKNTFGNLLLESVSLYYISPRLNNAILLFAGWNSMTDFNELSISNIGTQKKLTFTSLTQGANPIVVSGTADFNVSFYDDYYNELLITKSSMSVSATARYTISQTPEGSEIDNTNEGTMSVVS